MNEDRPVVDVGTRITPDFWTEGDSGFAAMGKPVPFSRQQKAYEVMQSFGFDDKSHCHDTIANTADLIRRDRPFEAIQFLMEAGVDLTGTYRLLATLLTD